MARLIIDFVGVVGIFVMGMIGGIISVELCSDDEEEGDKHD